MGDDISTSPDMHYATTSSNDTDPLMGLTMRHTLIDTDDLSNLSSSPPIDCLPPRGITPYDPSPVQNDSLGPLHSILVMVWESAGYHSAVRFTEQSLQELDPSELESGARDLHEPLVSSTQQLRRYYHANRDDQLGLLSLEHKTIHLFLSTMAANWKVRSLRFAALTVLVRIGDVVNDLEDRGAHTWGSYRAIELKRDLLATIIARSADRDPVARVLCAQTLRSWIDVLETGDAQAALNLMLLDSNEAVRVAAVTAGASDRHRLVLLSMYDYGSAARKCALDRLRQMPPSFEEAVKWLVDTKHDPTKTQVAAARVVWASIRSEVGPLDTRECLKLMANAVYPCPIFVGRALLQARPTSWSSFAKATIEEPQNPALISIVVAMSSRAGTLQVLDAIEALLIPHHINIKVLDMLSQVRIDVVIASDLTEKYCRCLQFLYPLVEEQNEDAVELLRCILDDWTDIAPEELWDIITPDLQQLSFGSGIASAAVAGVIEVSLYPGAPLFVSSASRRLMSFLKHPENGDLDTMASLVITIATHIDEAKSREIPIALKAMAQFYLAMSMRRPRRKVRSIPTGPLRKALEKLSSMPGGISDELMQFLVCLERSSAFDEPVMSAFSEHPALAQPYSVRTQDHRHSTITTNQDR